MTLLIAQSARTDDRHIGYWKWSVWIDGPDSDLDEIAAVEYRLHPTFKNRIRHSKARSKNFKISSSGWGEFRIYAEVTRKDGGKVNLKHWLRLREEEVRASAIAAVSPEANKRFRVFLSHSASDTRMADSIRQSLESRGVSVVSADTVPLGESFASSIESGIEGTDGTVVLMSASASPSIEREVEIARQMDVPVFPVMVADRNVERPSEWGTAERLMIKDLSDTEFLADDIAGRLMQQLTRKV